MSPEDPDDLEGKTRRSAGPLPAEPEELAPTTIREHREAPVFEPTVKRELDPLIGVTLGEYKVLSLLGGGAMGLVYRGVQPLIGRPVAIKVLKRELAQDPQHARRFLEEARSLSVARHPGIIDVFGFGETPAGEPYLVMELLEGQALDELLAERGKLSPAEAVTLLVPMLSALGAAHAAGVIHRDLKPANVFVVHLNDGTTFPKLLDFGLARRGAAGERLRQTSVGGTPLYMAPEQVRGEAVGPQADLYSFGCMAFELLAGRPPFTSANLREVIEQHLRLDPPKLRALAPEVPVELEQLVRELLTKDPSQRPATALEVRARLEAIQASLAVAAAPTRVQRALVTKKTDAATDAHPALRAEVPTEPERRAVERPTDPERPVRGARGLWGLGAVVVAALAVAAYVLLRPGEPAPTLVVVEPVTPPPPAPVVPPAPPEPKPATPPEAPPPEPPRPDEPPGTPKTPRHSAADARRYREELLVRAEALPEDLRRVAKKQLGDVKSCKRKPEACWRALRGIESTFFPK